MFFLQGLYKSGEREGPGVLTYPDGRQDVGLWHREKLVRLCKSTEGAFTLTDHPELKYNPDEHKVYITPETLHNRMDVISHIIDPPEQFRYEPHPAIKTEAIFTEGLHPRSLAIDLQTFDEEFFKQANSVTDLSKGDGDGDNIPSKSPPRSPSIKSQASDVKSEASGIKSPPGTPEPSLPPTPKIKSQSTASAKSDRSAKSKTPVDDKDNQSQRTGSANSVKSSGSQKSVRSEKSVSMVDAKSETKSEAKCESPVIEEKKILAWNPTPACIDMQKHVIRHEAAQGGVGFDVNTILDGERGQSFGE